MWTGFNSRIGPATFFLEYFHKSRLLYGLPAFIAQKSWINRVDKIIIKNIKKLLRLPKRAYSVGIKISLGIPNLCVYSISKLLRLKIKYENTFNEKLNIYDNVIEKTIGNIKGDIIYNNLKNIFNEYNYNINKNFKRLLNKRIYSWYVNEDFLLLKYMYHGGAFRKDINEKKKCVFCKTEDNVIEHITNNCIKFKKEREEIINKLNNLDNNTKYKTLL